MRNWKCLPHMVVLIVFIPASLGFTNRPVAFSAPPSSVHLAASTPQAETLVVTSTADSGPGTLRQVLSDASAGDRITFDPAIFPPDSPATISVESGLPEISQGNLTIDASTAGVILDGGAIASGTTDGLFITSDGNAIMGLQIIHFPANGITLERCSMNIIGGDRNIGISPLGQGNVLSENRESGIGVFSGASYNVIAGNYIGTDVTASKAVGNQFSGIIIGGGKHNMIGPKNTIAYNNGHGIEIASQDSKFNTITQNSIFDNNQTGIFQQNNDFIPPAIIEFDLTAGLVTGAACPKCLVEVYSDNEDEGMIYEGQTSADQDGLFRFEKGIAFTHSSLTAIGTDANGNTTAFSLPTVGEKKLIQFQTDNKNPLKLFHSKKTNDLEDNRMGTMRRLDVTSSDGVMITIDQQKYDELGLKRIRFTKDWFDFWEVEDSGEYSDFNINPYQDQAVAWLNDHGVVIRYDLVYWDENIQNGQTESRYSTEEEIQDYIDYVRFIVRHFKNQINTYEILNESNIGEDTQQHVESEYYINLIKIVAPIIREENPEAKIVIGAVTPLYDPAARDYLFNILNSDAMTLVDAISWHDGSSSPEYQADFYYSVPALVQEIKDAAYAHGFKGEFIMDEMHWRSSKDPNPLEYDQYSETASAKYYGRGIVRCLGMGLTSGLALESLDELPLTLNVIKNLSTLMAGAAPENLNVDISSNMQNIVMYSFSLSNEEKLIALWSDGVANDNDPGDLASLTLEKSSAQKVMGIDILNNIEQQLIMSNDNGSLVIPDLFIKDYPIILILSAS